MKDTEKTQRKAKLRKRFYSFFVDLMAIAFIYKIFMASFLVFASNYLGLVPPFIKARIFTNLSQVQVPLLFLTYFSYFFLSLYMSGGRTLGKTVFNLRVLSHEGDPEALSLMESFMRSLGYTFCYAGQFVLLAIPYFRNDQKGLPDFFSQTEVVTEFEYEVFLAEFKEIESSSNILPFQKKEEVQLSYNLEGDPNQTQSRDKQLDLFSRKAG